MAADKKAKIQSFEGLIAAPFTAFTPCGEINPEIIAKYVDHLVKQGVKAVYVNGTTGEGLSLTLVERKTLAEAWVKHSVGKLELVMIQVSANCLKDAQELAHHAQNIGATGILSLPPLYFRHKTIDTLVEYFKALAESAPNLPLMYYHVPCYSGVEVSLREFLPAVRKEVPNFTGVKYTSWNALDLLEMHALPGEPFKILSGYDEVLLPSLASGVTAAVGVTYNYMAPLSLKLIDAYKKGNLEEARKYQIQIMHADREICKYGPEISCFKATMNILGPIDFGAPRMPLASLDAKNLQNLKENLKILHTKEWN